MTVEQVTDYATRVLAANPGPMTLDGTNTWILRDPAADTAVVVDPGPLLTDHLQAVLDAVAEYGCTVSTVLLTRSEERRVGKEWRAWWAADQHARKSGRTGRA